MNRFSKALILLCVTLALMFASLLNCRMVHNYEEMADIRLGWPLPFLSVNMQRYTPLVFPQCFRVGSPWEDPMRVLWPAATINTAIIFGTLLILRSASRWMRRKGVSEG
jgi:hypothetical protein